MYAISGVLWELDWEAAYLRADNVLYEFRIDPAEAAALQPMRGGWVTLYCASLLVPGPMIDGRGSLAQIAYGFSSEDRLRAWWATRGGRPGAV